MIQSDCAFVDRRTLLAGLGVGAAAAAAPVLGLRLAGDVPGRPDPARGRSFQPLQSAGLAEWSGAVGERFGVETENGSHLLGVAAVAAFPGSGSRPAALGRSQAFSVAFELIAGPPLPAADRLYRLAHRAFPPLPVHMGAPLALGRTTRLIAVFN